MVSIAGGAKLGKNRIPAGWLMVILLFFVALVLLYLATTLALMMNLYLYLITEYLMLPMWPLSLYQHNRYCDSTGTDRVAGVLLNIA